MQSAASAEAHSNKIAIPPAVAFAEEPQPLFCDSSCGAVAGGATLEVIKIGSLNSVYAG